MRALVLVLCLVSTPVVAAEQFDLLCTAKKGEVRYRVDLKSGEYCAGDCERIAKIAEVTSGMLVLERVEKSHARGSESTVEINRNTGEWYTYSFNPTFEDIPFTRTGKCEPAPFSGWSQSTGSFKTLSD